LWGMLEPGMGVQFAAGAAWKRRWYDPATRPIADDFETAAGRIRQLVAAGSTERTISDVPVCTLLSGGIDSSAVLVDLLKAIPDITAYAAVMDPRSPDLKAARRLASELGVRLVEVRVPSPTADDLAAVVATIEMPFKAQVEIGWACIHLADAMHRDGFKVTFSGEGSDELWASYGFAYHALKTEGWHQYRKDLILDQGRKNFARCNKIFMAYSVECRLPFLHTPLVEYALSLRRESVQKKARPKAVMQEAYRGVLPDEIVKRQKLAFQDGMKMKAAAARAVADPKSFYSAEFRRLSAGSA
ncbi:MAG: asparagine synthase-related protein, partial [Mycobacteriales bacterium]